MAQTETELLDKPVGGRPTLNLRSPHFHSIIGALAEPLAPSTPPGRGLFRQQFRTSIIPPAVSVSGAREEALNGPLQRS